MPNRRRLRIPSIPRGYPNRAVLRDALREYAECRTFWYVPKVRTLTDQNISVCAQTLAIIDAEFSAALWDRDTQDALLARLTAAGLLKPRTRNATQADRTALVRITKDLFETLGLLWIAQNQTPVVTSAGLRLIDAADDRSAARDIIAQQVSKLQYPNPVMPNKYRSSFIGILPHFFLLDVLERMGDAITFDEYNLFLNLAASHADAERVCNYIEAWRSLSESQQHTLRERFATIPMWGANPDNPKASKRALLISRTASYQRSIFCFPNYTEHDADSQTIRCTDAAAAREILEAGLGKNKITAFEQREDWFAYFGDPSQEPSWFTYVAHQVMNAENSSAATEEIEAHAAELSTQQHREVRRLQIERAIEESYASQPDLLHTLEPSLQFENRQVKTPIGQIDLLCRGSDGKYVVIEVKARPADDAVFGQILRYMGWIHRNYEDGADNVRGIILASEFSDKAQYSRTGLMRDDANEHLKFRRHAFAVEEV